MSKWSAWKLTNAGKEIQTKAETGKVLYFTKIAIGDGYVDSTDVYIERTDLINPKLSMPIASATVEGNGFAKISSVLTNNNLKEAIYAREMGLFAEDPDSGEEKLFAAAVDDSADCIPEAGTATVITKTFNVFIAVGENATVTAKIDPDGIVMQEELTKLDDSIPTKAQLAVASAPSYYRRSNLATSAKTKITIAPTWVNIGNEGYVSKNNVVLDLAASDSWDSNGYTGGSARAGKDFYIYACQQDTGIPKFVLSANSTVPEGYSADNSRKIGGFHCLCLSVGKISGHTLSGYVTGDILPLSVWDLFHRPVSEPEGMVYVKPINRWVDIYLASGTGNPVSRFGGTILDGESSPRYHGDLFVEKFGMIGKKLPCRDEFEVFAKGSNETTNIKGSADPNTTGGHVDTNGRRMISNYGIEDCCGTIWQWMQDQYGGMNVSGYAWRDGTGNNDYWMQGCTWEPESKAGNADVDGDRNKYGKFYGSLARLLVGGSWGGGTACGSRSASVEDFGAYRHGNLAGRGASEPRSVNL